MDIDLIAVQPFMMLRDYLTEEAFRKRIASLFEKAAKRRSDETRPAIVVFPEMLGGFLGLMGQGKRIEGCKTTVEAMKAVAGGRMLPLLVSMLRHRTISLPRALLAALAPEVHAVYYDVFQKHSKEYGWYVVAGSLLAPRNVEGDDSPVMRPLDAQIYNTSYAFDPQGRCVAATRKVNLVPTQEDVLELSSGNASAQPLVDTPAGPLATAICYDGFAKAHTPSEPNFVPLVKSYDARGAVVVACPAANPWPWDEPWVFNGEGESLLRRDQWMAEGLFASMRGARTVRYGINPMLLGEILDHRFDGLSQIYERRAGNVQVIAAAARSDISAEAEEIVLATVPVRAGVRTAS